MFCLGLTQRMILISVNFQQKWLKLFGIAYHANTLRVYEYVFMSLFLVKQVAEVRGVYVQLV